MPKYPQEIQITCLLLTRFARAKKTHNVNAMRGGGKTPLIPVGDCDLADAQGFTTACDVLCQRPMDTNQSESRVEIYTKAQHRKTSPNTFRGDFSPIPRIYVK